jgi:hypothetical protein
MIAWIGQATHFELLRLNRYEPAHSPWFKGEVGERFFDTLLALRKADPEGAERDSKDLGWDE